MKYKIYYKSTLIYSSHAGVYNISEALKTPDTVLIKRDNIHDLRDVLINNINIIRKNKNTSSFDITNQFICKR